MGRTLAEAFAEAKAREADEIDPHNRWPVGSLWWDRQNEIYRENRQRARIRRALAEAEGRP